MQELLRDAEFMAFYMAESRRRLETAYRIVAEALDRLRLPFVSANATMGGLFVWVDFSEFRIPAVRLWKKLVQEYRVFLTPGNEFYDLNEFTDAVLTAGEKEEVILNCMHLRLCYACLPPEHLIEGLERLGKFVKAERSAR